MSITVKLNACCMTQIIYVLMGIFTMLMTIQLKNGKLSLFRLINGNGPFSTFGLSTYMDIRKKIYDGQRDAGCRMQDGQRGAGWKE